MKTINYVCSLGILCHTASLIKQNNLKKCSYPFDWIFSNPKMIIDCINDNFVTFLDRSLHTKHKDNTENKSGHKLYGEHIFNHHCILKDKHYEYFVRCVRRFRTLMKTNNNKLFVISFVNKKENITDNIQKQLNDLYMTLHKITNNFDLLIIWHTVGNKLKSNVLEDKNLQNLKFLNIMTTSNSDGSQIKDERENKFYNKCIFELYDFKIIDNIH